MVLDDKLKGWKKDGCAFYDDLKDQAKRVNSQYQRMKPGSFGNQRFEEHVVKKGGIKKKLIYAMAVCIAGGFLYDSFFTSTQEAPSTEVVMQKREELQPKNLQPKKPEPVTREPDINKTPKAEREGDVKVNPDNYSLFEEKLENKTFEKPSYAEKPKPSRDKQPDYELLSKPSDYLYFIVRGDTLSKIARDVSGDMYKWKQIQAYNGLDSTLIEVNQVLRIPGYLAKNKRNLQDCVLVDRIKEFDGKHIPFNYILADKNDDFWDISRRMYGTSRHADEIFSYNSKINPRFSKRIYNNEFIYKPPRGFLNAR